MSNEQVKCRGCGEYIVWLKTKNGKNMPVEPETVDHDDDEFDHTKHEAHWGNCPKADQFR